MRREFASCGKTSPIKRLKLLESEPPRICRRRAHSHRRGAGKADAEIRRAATASSFLSGIRCGTTARSTRCSSSRRFARRWPAMAAARARHRGRREGGRPASGKGGAGPSGREGHGDLGRHDLPHGLLGGFSAVFNPHGLAKVLGDKRSTNDHLSARGIRMPGRAEPGKPAFSLPRQG